VAETDVDELYRLPLSDFTAARNELAKRLKAEGREDESEHVRTLRKPTVPVWLVNRLAQERELDVQRLRKAGESLTDATGGGADDFRRAQREEHRALARLGDAARELARREGVSASAADRALETLRAASLTQEGRELLKGGVFTEELDPPGFEALTGVLQVAPSSKGPAEAAPAKVDRRAALKEARARVNELRAEERELVASAREAVREATRSEKHAADARRKADEAQADAEDAADRRAAAEAELEDLTP
jgi:hypothetical protein